jgi:hypothetical protein
MQYNNHYQRTELTHRAHALFYLPPLKSCSDCNLFSLFDEHSTSVNQVYMTEYAEDFKEPEKDLSEF